MSRPPAPPPPSRPATTAAATVHISFDAGQSGLGSRPVRTYVDPRPAAAAVSPTEPPATPTAPAWPEPTDGVTVWSTADRRPTAAADAWLARPDHDDAPLAVAVPVVGGRLRWRPGRVVIEGSIADRDAVLAGLADFAFYEGELRRLEAVLPAHEATAAADAAIAFRIADGDRAQWSRLGHTMEQLAAHRLTFARLEPRLGRPSPSLPLAGRRTFARLCRRAAVEDRLAAVSDRLEACEDLYEGAVDRITDHGWWRKGHRLETVIVVLLAVEGLQLGVELVLHILQLQGR